MEKSLTMSGAIVLGTLLLFNCGGKKEIEVKPNTTKLEGDLSEYFEIVDNSYKVVESKEMGEDWKVSVQVKKNEKAVPFTYKDIDNNLNIDNRVYLDLLDVAGTPILNFEKFQMKEYLQNFIELKPNEVTYLTFTKEVPEENRKSLPETINKFKIHSKITLWENSPNKSSSETTPESAPEEVSAGDMKTMLSDYEKFVDEYIKVFKKSMALNKKAQSGDQNIATEAASISQQSMGLMEKAQSLGDKMEKLKGQMSNSDVEKFIKIQTKLASAAAESI